MKINRPKNKLAILIVHLIVTIITIAIYIAVIVFIVSILPSCASQKESHEHQTHIVVADTLAQEARHDGHHQTTARDIDSIVTASVWAAMQEFVKSEQEHEVTTETLTETIDSLGRIIRQQQKTTDRTLSRQEQQRQQQELQQMEVRLYETLRKSDSAWNERIIRMEAHLRDSLSAQIDRQSQVNATPSATWWQKLWSKMQGFIIGAAVAVAIILLRRFANKIKR